QGAAGGGQAAAAPRLLLARDGPLDRRGSRRRLVRGAVRRPGALQAPAAQEVPFADAVREGERQAAGAGALAHDHRWLARRPGLQRIRVLPLQGLGRRTARDPPRGLGAGLDRARLDAHPVVGQRQDRQRQVAEHRELRRARPRVSVGLRPHRGLFRGPRPERPQRLRQRRARARLVGLPVDLQRQRLLPRLPPAPEPPGHPPLLFHPQAPPHEGVRRPADELHAAVPLEEHGLRDAHPVAWLPLRARSADAGQRPRGEHHGRPEEADPRLRPRALEQVPARPAAAPATGGRQGRRRQLLRRVAYVVGAAALALAPLALYAAVDGGATPGEAAPPAAVASPSPNVRSIFTIVPSSKKAMVFWGKKRLGIIAPHAPLVVTRPRDSGPLDVVVKSDGFVTVQTRAYTFA